VPSNIDRWDEVRDTLNRSLLGWSNYFSFPHINIRSPRLQPGKFAIGETKRLLQHYRPDSDIAIWPLMSVLTPGTDMQSSSAVAAAAMQLPSERGCETEQMRTRNGAGYSASS
jgi:hypothetical protein